MNRKNQDCSLSEDRAPIILLVEDEIMIRLADAESLRDEGFCVIEAECGEEAIAVLASSADVDLLVTDITMPDGPDGLAVAQFCRERRPDVPILMASARLPGAGDPRADRMMPKPYTVSELISAVTEMLGSSWKPKKDRKAC